MNEPCGCYFGKDCTKTTVCQLCAAVEDKEEEIKRLKEKLLKANARERSAFFAGFKDGRNHPDIEQAWQQYRCLDDTDWATAKEVEPTEANLLDPYVLQLIETIARQDDRIEDLENQLKRINA